MNMESILKCTANFRDYLLKDLAEPRFAKQYLEVSLEKYEKDGDIDILVHAIRNVVLAQGESRNLPSRQTAIFKISMMRLMPVILRI